MNTMKAIAALALIVAGGSATAADHSVAGVGAGLNLYSITDKGVQLVKSSPYLLGEVDPSGHLFQPVTLSMNPTHNFVYVVYQGSGVQPNIVGFEITPEKLVKKWEAELITGDALLDGSSITAVDNYVIENIFPSGSLWVKVVTQAGQEVVYDQGSNSADLVSGHIDQNGKFYYSCRFISPTFGARGPANTVVVYDLKDDGFVSHSSTPLFTSTDPTFVRSICN